MSASMDIAIRKIQSSINDKMNSLDYNLSLTQNSLHLMERIVKDVILDSVRKGAIISDINSVDEFLCTISCKCGHFNECGNFIEGSEYSKQFGKIYVFSGSKSLEDGLRKDLKFKVEQWELDREKKLRDLKEFENRIEMKADIVSLNFIDIVENPLTEKDFPRDKLTNLYVAMREPNGSILVSFAQAYYDDDGDLIIDVSFEFPRGGSEFAPIVDGKNKGYYRECKHMFNNPSYIIQWSKDIGVLHESYHK